MPDPWTGNLIGRMHNERVTAAEMADEMGCSAGTVWNYFNKDKEDKKDVSENQ